MKIIRSEKKIYIATKTCITIVLEYPLTELDKKLIKMVKNREKGKVYSEL